MIHISIIEVLLPEIYKDAVIVSHVNLGVVLVRITEQNR
jgi:hypothetical protein